jgi:hypothetical protein
MDKEIEALGAAVARDIFALGSEPSREGGIVQRIQFLGGQWPENELPLGGLRESALAKVIAESLERNLQRPEET